MPDFFDSAPDPRLAAAIADHPRREFFAREVAPGDYFRALPVSAIFADDHPLEIDLGCGDGRFLLRMAAHFPERNFLGVERLLGRVRKVCRLAGERGLENLRVLRLESGYAIGWLLPAACADRLHLLCPDPWPKQKHWRRRIFQVPFLDAARRVLKPGGELLFKTDHPDYFRWAQRVIAGYPGFEPLGWPDDAFFYPETDFERHWLRQGKAIGRMRLRRAD